MSNASAPRDEAELKDFLGRQSPVSAAYAAIEPVPPPEVLDGKILAMARGAVTPAVARPPAAPKPMAAPADKTQPAVPAAIEQPSPPRRPVGQPAPAARPAPRPESDDDTDDTSPAGRPRWLVPAALAAGLLVAVGIGVAMLGAGDSWEPEADGSNPLGALFAKRARARSEADKAAAAAAQQEAAVVDLPPLPPPPLFEPEGPQIEDLDTAIALIRKELVRANQLAAMQEEARASGPEAAAEASPVAPPDGAEAPVPAPGAEASAGVVQPRDRRLTKILELYDGGNPELAAASLEIFLRDFEDDPISQRILDSQPKATDIAVD